MAVGWLNVLKAVPWSEVISAAPHVAGGARKLWESVARKPAPASVPDVDLSKPGNPLDAADPAVLAAQLVQHQAALTQLQGQVRAASQLITELADQNAQLIAKMQATRERVRLVGLVAAGAFTVAVVTLAMLLART